MSIVNIVEKDAKRLSGGTIEKIQQSDIFLKEIYQSFYLPFSKLPASSQIAKEFNENGKVIKFETNFGTIEYRNKLLTEAHKRVISAIIKHSIVEESDRGLPVIVFKAADMLKVLKMGEKNYAQLKNYIVNIYDASYEISLDKKSAYSFRIIDKYYFEDIHKNGIIKIVLTEEYVKMIENDYSISLNSIYKNMINLRESTIPSIIQHILINSTEKKKSIYSLLEILEAIRFPITNTRSVRRIRNSIIDFSETLLKDYGISYNDKTMEFTYKNKHKDIKLNPPVKEEIDELKTYAGKTIRFDKKNYEIKNIRKSASGYIIETTTSDLSTQLGLYDLKRWINSILI